MPSYKKMKQEMGETVMKRFVQLLLTCLNMAFPVLFCSYALAQPIGFMSPKTVQQTQYQCLSSPQGRFVFGQISDSAKDQFMLDTWTGRLWRISESGEVGKFLAPVPYKLKDGTYAPVPEKIVPDQVAPQCKKQAK